MLTLAISASFALGFAAWEFNKTDNVAEISNISISNWTFAPIEEGTNIVIDTDGNGTVTDEDGNVITTDVEVTYPDGTNVDVHGGEVTIDIGTNDEGDLVVTDYHATDVNGDTSLFSGGSSSEICFPETIIINGEEYDVVAINTPVTISATNGFFWNNNSVSVTVPEGYISICDEAFQNVNASTGWLISGSTTFNYHLPESLQYLGYHAIKLNVSGGSVTVNYSGTRAQFRALVSASAAAYLGQGTYCFVTGENNNTTCTVTCSDGSLTCYQNGNIT